MVHHLTGHVKRAVKAPQRVAERYGKHAEITNSDFVRPGLFWVFESLGIASFR